MRYLYFQPKPSLKTQNTWLLPRHQNILSLLKDCSSARQLNQIHGQMIRTGLIQDTFSVSHIIAFLTVPSTTHFNMDYGRRIFNQIRHPSPFIWNLMIRGYTHTHAPKEALLLYKQMLLRGFCPDNYTYPIVTKSCCHLCALDPGKMLHAKVVKCGFESDKVIISGFVNLYACCGRVEIARKLFDEMPEKDVVSWTTMIYGYARSDHLNEAFLFLDEMKMAGVEPNKVTIVNLLSACGQLHDLYKGRWLHSYIVGNEMEHDLAIENSLINMYAKCGNMSNAVEIFKNMPARNTVSWNILIGAFTQCGLFVEALSLFQEMLHSDVRPNEITMVSILSACAQLRDLEQGKLFHDYIENNIIRCDTFIRNALVDMYAKCGDLEAAACIFREIPNKDVFSWTSMIAGYEQRNLYKEALALFQDMQLSSVKPNEVTLVSLLSACGQLGALDQGKLLHSYIEENNVRQDTCLINVLVDMYARCGSIDSAVQVFDGMTCKDTFSWNAMIGGLAMHGHGREAIDLFKKMLRSGDTKPDHVTLTSVLVACSHSGMVQQGCFYFSSMYSLFGINPRIKHYGCMVDLLGRAGLFEEAINFIEKMPIEPNSVIWGSLLAACRIHQKVKLGEEVANHLFKLAPDDEGAHVLMSNIYADAGRWDDVRTVRSLMGGKGMEKSPGFSSIEVNGIVHDFLVGDTLQIGHDRIYSVLNSLTLQLKQAGYEMDYSHV